MVQTKAKKQKPTLTPQLSAANRQHQVEAALADDLGVAQHNPKRVPPARGPPADRPRRGEQLRTRIANSGLQLNDPCRLLRARDLSLLLTVHELTIWAWVRDGNLPKPFNSAATPKLGAPSISRLG